ncbi:MAG: hypothetical protein L0387_34940 [Acidobacteria bacterium]|nr:hypothetical protein [Acidobacteriota bacterium]
MAEDDNNHFDSLTKDLSPEQRSEFFQVLLTAGISRQDVELTHLLRALQLYRAFYDEIPARVCQAVKEADALHQTFKSLHESAATRLDRAVNHLERNLTAASTITNEFRESRAVVATVIQKSTIDIAQTLETTLKKSLSSGLVAPFEKFMNDIRDQCTRTTIEADQISLQLKQARRIHIGGYALAAVVVYPRADSGGLDQRRSTLCRTGTAVDSTNRPESRGTVRTGSQGNNPESRAQSKGSQQALSDHRARHGLDGRPECRGRAQVVSQDSTIPHR